MQASSSRYNETSEPFSSLNSMREEHLRLLEAQGDNAEMAAQRASEIAPLIEEFLRRGVALGRAIDSLRLRAEAQSMLDYWVSTSSIQQRGQATESVRVFPSAILERFDPKLHEVSIVKAKAAFSNLSAAEQAELRQMILRLAPLPEKGDVVTLACKSTADLTGGKKNLSELLKQFEKTGIVQQSNAEAGETDDKWQLANDSVVSQWSGLREWLEERRRFRRAARLWADAGRDAYHLTESKSVIEDAVGYGDLNSTERDFLQASTKAVNTIESKKRRGLAIALATAVTLAVLALVLGAYYLEASNLRGNIIEISKQKTEAVEESAKLTKELTGTYTLPPEVAELRAENQKLKDELSKVNQGVVALREQLSATQLPSQAKSQLTSLVTATEFPPTSVTDGQAVVQALQHKANSTLAPGIAVSDRMGADKSYGSAGIFLADDQGAVYLAAPSYVIGSDIGQSVTVGDKKVGSIFKILGTAPGNPTDIAIAKLELGIKAENLVPIVGAITGPLLYPALGTEVILIGQGSGIRSGKVKSIDASGAILTTRISQPGDGGSPVLTRNGELIGLLLLGRDEESVVSPIGPILEQSGLKLLISVRKKSPLQGALAQVIVPNSDKKYLTCGRKLISDLKELGVFVPDGAALPRAKSPDTTEVRYYRASDQKLADEVVNQLKLLGVNEVVVKRLADEDPPDRFLQISFEKSELDLVCRRLGLEK